MRHHSKKYATCLHHKNLAFVGQNRDPLKLTVHKLERQLDFNKTVEPNEKKLVESFFNFNGVRCHSRVDEKTNTETEIDRITTF